MDCIEKKLLGKAFIIPRWLTGMIIGIRRLIVMMRAIAPQSLTVQKFEESGDIIYWHQFIEEMRKSTAPLTIDGDFT